MERVTLTIAGQSYSADLPDGLTADAIAAYCAAHGYAERTIPVVAGGEPVLDEAGQPAFESPADQGVDPALYFARCLLQSALAEVRTHKLAALDQQLAAQRRAAVDQINAAFAAGTPVDA